MYYVIVRTELDCNKYDSIAFPLFRKFETYDEAYKYACECISELAEYPMWCDAEIVKTCENR